MMQISVTPTKTAPRLPDPALPLADWADRYEIVVPAMELTAIEAARLALGHFPRWVRVLMAIRNAAVAPFGLKSSGYHSPNAVEMIGLFPVLSQSAHQAVLGFDDHHLDFRIVVDVDDSSKGKVVGVTTLVQRKILFGRIYIAVITPFHNLIVSAMLSNVGKRFAGSEAR
ncbi:DUF2867 domain-containing protein [Neorhizobium galegae]|uniref:DUF2867 domain-containing protein n=1 Tax=Neorhizobium galegae TaxID=399 RepID=UPI00351EE41A